MDVIIAARLSKKAKGYAKSGIEDQDEDAREWAQEQGHNVIATVPDTASGTKAMWQRQNLAPWVTDPELMARYHGIVAAKQDRLSRADWSEEADLRKWAEANGKTLFIVDRDLRWPPRDDSHHDDDVAAWNRGAEEAHREWNNTSRRYRRMQKNRKDNNAPTRRAPYGFKTAGVSCGQSPCECWKNQIADHKTFIPDESQARVIREAKDRYLAGETLEAITDDFNSRGVPSPKGGKWWPRTLGKVLRSPSTAGRQMDNSDSTDESQRKTIMTYPGILTWAEHEQIAARMDSRAHRRGISPYNVTLLTGIVFDAAGHTLYSVTNPKGKRIRYYACRKRCGICVPLADADAVAASAVLDVYGNEPHMMRRVIPGKNHFEEIAKLRRDRAELDDLADSYPEQHAALTAEIRRLAKEDRDNPQPDQVKWVKSGRTVAQHWESLDIPGRRDWLKERGFKFTIAKIDEGWEMSYHTTAEVAGTSLGGVRVVRRIMRKQRYAQIRKKNTGNRKTT